MTVISRPEELSDAVVVYVTRFCGYCWAAKRLLEARGIDYLAIDVGGAQEARQWLAERSGQRTVPQVFIKQRSIGGYTELAALDASGELARLLTAAS